MTPFRNRGSISVPSYSFKFTRGSQVRKITQNHQNSAQQHSVARNTQGTGNTNKMRNSDLQNNLNLPFYFQNADTTTASSQHNIVQPLDDKRVGQNSKRLTSPQVKRLMHNKSHLWVVPKTARRAPIVERSYERQNLRSVSAKIQAKLRKQNIPEKLENFNLCFIFS